MKMQKARGRTSACYTAVTRFPEKWERSQKWEPTVFWRKQTSSVRTPIRSTVVRIPDTCSSIYFICSTSDHRHTAVRSDYPRHAQPSYSYEVRQPRYLRQTLHVPPSVERAWKHCHLQHISATLPTWYTFGRPRVGWRLARRAFSQNKKKR